MITTISRINLSGLKRIKYPSRYVIRKTSSSNSLNSLDSFGRRHIGPNSSDAQSMLDLCGVRSLEELANKAVPNEILLKKDLNLGPELSESECILRLKEIASKNKVYKSYIGMGYYQSILPPVIQRNILENPQWYTQYTPYQPEISQGRLESLLNYQTMVSDLTGLPIANSSLLDEGTAAAEAMVMCYSASKKAKKAFFVDSNVHPQTIACMKTRAEGFDIDVIVGHLASFDFQANKDKVSGILIQYPCTYGSINDYEGYVKQVHEIGAQVVCATDLMALTMLKPPGEFGADIVLGNSQRLGVTLGFGGPHAAFFACTEKHRRKLPGRIVGVSKDVSGKPAYRLALQTREQHIRREKATSNICTAQALLANISAMYGVYHGPQGLKDIASRIHEITKVTAISLQKLGYSLRSNVFFDTVTIDGIDNVSELIEAADKMKINVRQISNSSVGVSLDESVSKQDLKQLIGVFEKAKGFEIGHTDIDSIASSIDSFNIPKKFLRTSAFMNHPVFNSYHCETEMLRYISRLQAKDLSLAHAMIPLGSCTMKLNATTEMLPISWPEFSSIHPFVPENQTKGYEELLMDLSDCLAKITGFDDVSLQPNSGAQGELAGLKVIRRYFESIDAKNRDVCLIPVSAHGTNPASAYMAGMKVVVVQCDSEGKLDLQDLKQKVETHKDNLACMMITYPSTFGVFEAGISEVCELIHQNGGQIYLDGANLNAQVGLCRPGDYGADVCHLNLHKTFCIPHGGGGPGMGPIGVKNHLAPFLPSHPVIPMGGKQGIGPISAAPFGSASILPISWAYIRMMGGSGLKKASEVAILNANYMARKLSDHYKILFTNANGMCAHEFIIDIRPFSNFGIEAIDVAKRLQDYGFHSPTMSWPVANTLMIEPTESESKSELDRFCEAMISIRKEIQEVEDGKQPKGNNVLTNSPHPLEILMTEPWNKPYSREKAAYPIPWTRVGARGKFWPTTQRVDDAFGDRNLICSCPPISDYME